MKIFKLVFFIYFICSTNSFANIKIIGTIQDHSSRHTLEGANIYFVGNRIGTVSDNHGRFELIIPIIEIDTLIVSYIGYHVQRIAIAPMQRDSMKLHVYLVRNVLILNEFLVEANRFEDEISSLKMEPGALRMNLKDIRTVPYTLFPDINRSLQFLPGVISTNDLTNELNVRGGSPDQNLVLLEGVPVYYPFHIFGLASAFSPDMVGEVHFSPGGFSAKYGNRLSSVLNVRTHSPQKKLETSADISMIAADVTISGRWKQRLEWIGSFRKSFYDQFFRGTEYSVPYSFYDAFGKMSFTLNSNNTISIMYFSFQDQFRDQETYENTLNVSEDTLQEYTWYDEITQRDYSWHNRLLSFAWDHRLFSTFCTNIKVYQSLAKNDFKKFYTAQFPPNLPPQYNESKNNLLSLYNKNKVNVTNSFLDQTVDINFDWKLNTLLTFNGGVQKTKFNTDYGWGRSDLPYTPVFDYNEYIRIYFDHAPKTSFNFNQTFRLKTGFAELLWNSTPKLNVRMGMRISKWDTQFKTVLEPRFNVHYKLSEHWSLKTSYGQFTQGISTALEGGVVGFLRLYFPVGDSLKLESADHYIISAEFNGGINKKFLITTYLKNYYNLIKSIGPDPNFIQTPGKAYGLELFFKDQLYGWDSWLSFTLSHAYRLVNKSKYDFNWDQRYRFDIYASKEIGLKWKFSWAWVLYSGIPYAPDEYITVLRDGNWRRGLINMENEKFDQQPIDVPPGSIRYPWYHRLDIGLTREFHFSTWHMELYLSIRNVYARKNPLFYERSQLISDENEHGLLTNFRITHPNKWLPTLPTVGARIVF